MKTLAFILFILCFQSYAGQVIRLENSWNLFSQKLGPGFILPDPLSAKEKLNVNFELPDTNRPALRKVFSQTSEVNEFKAVFEVYFFNENSQKYLSQQVFLYKEGLLITRCTSYFGLEQKFLVPGSCAGVLSGELLGVAIYK